MAAPVVLIAIMVAVGSSSPNSSGDYDYGFSKGHDAWMRNPGLFDEYRDLCESYARDAAAWYENVDQDEIVDGCLDGVAEARENPLG